MFEHILVPLDGSTFGARAIKYADEIAQRFGANIELLHVVKPATPVPASAGAIPGTETPISIEISMKAAAEEDKRQIAKARRYLSRKVRENKALGINTRYLVVVGDPVESIIKFAHRDHIDLLVITTHGKGGLKRAIWGSVADAVIRKSKKPVLVVSPRKRRKN
jgi:nucleotide-binding universal stress UspA family protein